MVDRDELRRQALQAAASVALALTTGCGGARAPSVAPSVDPAAGTAPAPAAAAGPIGVPAAEPVSCADPAVTDITACCHALRVSCTERFGDEDPEAAMACLFGDGFSGLTGCSPWGPPVPPAMA